MVWNPGLLSALLFAASGILALLSGIGWRRRRNGVTAFVFLMVSASSWAAIYGIQLGFTTAAEQLPWQRATLAVSATVPPAFLAFAYRYSNERARLPGWSRRLLVGETAAFAGLALTNPRHDLVWSRATLNADAPWPVLDIAFASGYYLHIAFAYLVVLLGLWTVASVYLRSRSLYRNQSLLLLTGACPAFVTHLLYTAKAGPIPGLDLTPFAFVFTGVTFGAALFRFDLLERTPVAHQRAIELTGDGLLVVDTEGMIVDSNHTARQLYHGDVEAGTHVSAITDATDPRELDGATTTGLVDGLRRTYDVYVSELASGSGPPAGFSIVLRDVTDREGYEQRLEVAYRVLRHNLRNDVNVIMGRADILAETATTREQRELAEGIRGKGGDLVDLSEKARQMVDIQQASRAERETVDVVPVLESLLGEFRREYPTVPVTIDCPDEAHATVTSEHALSVAVRNILENTPKHNDVSELSVDVAVAVDGDHTRIEVSDTGSGMPVLEQEVLRNDTETPLHHSRGLGLWLAYWIVSTSGGDISVSASEAAGTTITLTFVN